MKRMIGFSVLAFFAVLLIAAVALFPSDEDFQPYHHSVNELDNALLGNVFVVGDIETELAEIADSFEEEFILAYAVYTFQNDSNDAASVYYIKYKDNGRTAILQIDIDTEKKSAVRAYYSEGISKRVGLSFSQPIGDNKKVNVYDVYQKLIGDMNKYDMENMSDMPIRITVTSDNVYKVVMADGVFSAVSQ